MERSSITGRLEDASPSKARRLSDVPYNFQPSYPPVPASAQSGFRLKLCNLASARLGSASLDALADTAVSEYRAGRTRSLRDFARSRGMSLDS